MEKDSLSKQNRDINRNMMLWACDHSNNSSSTYSSFLTTLAGIFLGLSPLLIDEKIIKNNALIKIFVSVSIISIFISLIFGGIYIYCKRKFFSKWTDNYAKIFVKWNECKTAEDERDAMSCENCIFSTNKTGSPQWPLMAQAIFLFSGMLVSVLIIIIKIVKF